MRKIFVITILISTFAFTNLIIAQDCDFKIIIRAGRKEIIRFGYQTELNYPPRVKNNRIFLQSRSFDNIFVYRAEFLYDIANKSVTIVSAYNNNKVSCIIDSNIGYVNDKKVTIDKNSVVKPYIVDNLTMLPLRFIFENLYPEGRIEWDHKTKTATLIINDYECDNYSLDWAMQDGNPGKTRNIPEYSAPRTGDLSLHGSFQFNDSTMPIIFDGKMLYSKAAGNYNCIDIATKATLWDSENFPPFGTPAYKDGKITFFGIESYDASSGKSFWKKDSWDSYEMLSDSIIYGQNTYSLNYKTNGNNLISCSENKTGRVIWEQNTGNELIILSAIANNKLFLYVQTENISAIRCVQANTGKFIWEKTSLRKLVCADKDVVISEDSCMNAENGNQLWKLPYTSKEITLSEDNLLQSAEKISCYDKKTGRNIWTKDIKVFSPIIAGDKVFATNGGTLYCLNKTNGDILWKYDANFTHHSMITSGGYIALMGKNAIRILKEKN